MSGFPFPPPPKVPLRERVLYVGFRVFCFLVIAVLTLLPNGRGIWVLMGIGVALIVNGLWRMWRRRCGYCRSTHETTPVPVPGVWHQRSWWDIRPEPPHSITWVCPRHFNTYLATNINAIRRGDVPPPPTPPRRRKK